jgi:hypothetical protein
MVHAHSHIPTNPSHAGMQLWMGVQKYRCAITGSPLGDINEYDNAICSGSPDAYGGYECPAGMTCYEVDFNPHHGTSVVGMQWVCSV